ncbi:MAG: hypothetical protein ISS74_00335 [Planctomycetes bacterium]|nr:hypothetical protein [Planctomycetota bacterium]
MTSGKLAILILMGLGAATFGVSYGLSLWLGAGVGTAAAMVAGDAAKDAALADAPLEEPAPPATAHLEEKHLMALVHQVRAKMDECRDREKDLSAQEKRIQIACDDLRREAQQLETLRTHMATAAAKLRESREALEQTRLIVAADEQSSLRRTAAIYDKMDAAEAAGIIESMCKNAQDADAVKILQFMEERTAAKVLAAIKDKDLVAGITQKMKRMHNPKQEG